MNPPNGITVIPNTDQWVVSGDSHLGKWSLEKGTIVTDPCLFRWLKPYLENVHTALDVGANIGDHTRQYLDWGFTTVAVEPNPAAFLCLAHNCAEAICVNAAASDSTGEPLRFLRLENVGASRIHPDGDILVNTVILDDENLPDPQLIKADVEGHELHALRGMERTIRRCKPLIFCEINRGALTDAGTSPEELISYVTSLGYSSDTVYPPTATAADPQYDILFQPIP